MSSWLRRREGETGCHAERLGGKEWYKRLLAGTTILVQ
jgi:hypothetical protein